MSSSLTWRPRKVENQTLDMNLKFALRKKYGDCIDHIFSRDDIGFLEGLAAADVEDAQKLIELIEKYDEVEVKEEW